jgi:hypothetical protein
MCYLLSVVFLQCHKCVVLLMLFCFAIVTMCYPFTMSQMCRPFSVFLQLSRCIIPLQCRNVLSLYNVVMCYPFNVIALQCCDMLLL